MCGIGRRTAVRLQKMGIFNMYQLSQTPPQVLKNVMGVVGEQLYYHAHGIDYSLLNEKYVPVSKSYGKSQILEKDYHVPAEVEIVIREMVEEVAMRLRQNHVDTAVIHLSVGYSKYSIKKDSAIKLKSLLLVVVMRLFLISSNYLDVTMNANPYAPLLFHAVRLL